MESTASTFTVEIEGRKKQQHKQNSIFFTYRYTNRKAAAASLYSCRKPGTPSRTRHTLLSNQPHYVSHNPYGFVHSTGQAGWLPSSFPRSRVSSVSFSFSPASCCVQASALFIIIQHPRCSCSSSTSEGDLVKSAVISFPLSLFPILSSPLSSSLVSFPFLSLSPPRLLHAHSKLRF